MRLPRPIRIVIYLWLAYALIGNAVLNTALGPTLVNWKPEAFRLEWDRALTLWPGQAWLWNARARGHVRRLVWQAQARHAGGRIALLPLFAKTLRLPRIDAHEVHVELDRVEQDRLPPKARPGGWTVRLDAILGDSVRRIRVGPVWIEGDGAARFGLRKQLRGGPLEILPSTLNLSQVRVQAGSTSWLTAGRIDAAFALPRHRRERAPGVSRLGLADMHLLVSGALQSLDIELDEGGHWHLAVVDAKSSASVSDNAGTAPHETAGRLDLDLALQRGLLQSGGFVRAQVPVLTRDGEGRCASAEGRIDLRIEDNIAVHLDLPPPPGDGGHLQADLTVAGRSLPFECHEPAADAIDLGPTCAFHSDPQAQLRRLAGTVAMRWHFDTLDWLGPVLSRVTWLRLEGAGEVDADVRIEHGTIAAGSVLTVPALNVTADVLDNRIDGEARAEAHIEAGDGENRMQVALTVGRFSMRPIDAPDDIHVRGRDLRLDLEASGVMAGLRKNTNARLRFADADVPDLTVYNRYLPRGGLRLLGGRGKLGGDLQLDAAGDVGHGHFDVQAAGAQLALGDVELGGDLAIRAQLKRADLATRTFDLDGSTVALTHVRMADAERASITDWWVRGRLRQGRVEWHRPMRIDARFDAEAKNAGLLLALFARHRDYPRWAMRLIDAGQARVDGRIRMREEGLILDPLHAANERFDVQARLTVADRMPRGDLLLAWRRLKLGLELGNGERHWHLRDAAEWFANRERTAVPP